MLEKIKEHPDWFAAVLIATVVGALNISGLVEKMRPARNNEQIANYREMAAHEMRTGLKPLADNHFLKASEQILIAIQFEVEQALGIGGRNLVQANLIWLRAENDERSIEVVARSKPGICPVAYPWNETLMACRAIAMNATVIHCRVRALPGYGDKKYNCVAATPITHRDRAFGAVTVDSVEPSTFANQEALLDRIIRPYAAELLLTLPKDAPYHPCANRNIR